MLYPVKIVGTKTTSVCPLVQKDPTGSDKASHTTSASTSYKRWIL